MQNCHTYRNRLTRSLTFLSGQTVLCLSAALLTACADDVIESTVPSPSYVSYSCNIGTVNDIMQQTKQTHLNCPGGYVRIYDRKALTASDEVGVGGLLLIHNYNEQYYAFDLACPYCYSQNQTVQRITMDDAFSAYCPTCESIFGVVMYGSPAPTGGPANGARNILRQYKASLLIDGTTLVVTR